MDRTFASRLYSKMKGTLALVVSLLLVFCTGMKETGSIDYKILDRDIYFQKDSSSFEIDVELNNTTSENFILYGFQRTMYSFLSDSSLRAKPSGAGNAIFITDDEGKAMPEEFTIEMHRDDYLQNPVTEDSLYNLFRKIRSEYADGKQVLKFGEKKRVKLRVNVRSSSPLQHLKPGKYLTYLIYFAEDDLTRTVEEGPIKVSLVDEVVIKSDVKRYQATVFSGWVRSNRVRLVVR